MVPYEDAFDEGDELVIEFPNDADKLMKDLKSKGAPSFKVLEREEYSDFAKKKNEELTAKQKKIDMNKDGKITGDDLAKLRAKGAKKEEVKEEVSLAELAAKHISDMWAEASKSSKKEEEEPKSKKETKTTMTGKPMSDIEVSPKDKEED
jgi:phage-related tail fiber protein